MLAVEEINFKKITNVELVIFFYAFHNIK